MAPQISHMQSSMPMPKRRRTSYSSAAAATQLLLPTHASAVSRPISQNNAPLVILAADRPTLGHGLSHLMRPIAEDPSISSLHDGVVARRYPNPFLKRNGRREHRLSARVNPQNIEDSTYIKINRNSNKSSRSPATADGKSVAIDLPWCRLLALPSNFGRGLTLGNELDKHFLKFYLYSYCAGRTLLPQNYWLQDVAPLAESCAGVKHAVLALSGGYLLDFKPEAAVRRRVSDHLQRAFQFITTSLKDIEARKDAPIDVALAAIMVLIADDLVQYEQHPPRDQTPNWLSAARIANNILDGAHATVSNLRTSNANRVAFINILVDSLTPVEPSSASRPKYQWLFEGGRRTPTNENRHPFSADARKDSLRIHSGTGISPRLLFFFSQITSMTAKLMHNPESTVFRRGMDHIWERLNHMRQWSDLSPEDSTDRDTSTDPKASMDRSPLDMTELEYDACGKVTTAQVLVHFIGVSWIEAIKIYALCRFYRLPRSHSDVQDCLDNLTACIDRMPFKGHLFTSQAPFFPVFFMGLMSRPDQKSRAVALEWFETVTSSPRSRSSVPPVFEALKATWQRMDKQPEAYESSDLDKDIGNRDPWYEDLVKDFVKHHGIISLF